MADASTPVAAVGNASVFLLSFEIHRAETLTEAVRITVDGRQILIYPPFRNGKGLGIHRSLLNKSLPFLLGTPVPANLLPQPDIQGATNWGEPAVEADAVRIDMEGKHDPALIEEVGQRLFRLIRLVTRQWWILRGASESVKPPQNHFHIDSAGIPVGGQLQVTGRLIPWLQSENLLTQQTLRVACDYFEAGIDIPDSCATLLDAVFEMNHGNRKNAILLAAIACESLFSEQVRNAQSRGAMTPSDTKQILKTPDLTDRVNTGAKLAFGHSFRDDHPKEWEDLGLLWVARHSLAHGSRPLQDRNPVFVNRGKFNDAMWSAFRLFEWLAGLWPRPLLDPMREMILPMVGPPGRIKYDFRPVASNPS